MFNKISEWYNGKEVITEYDNEDQSVIILPSIHTEYHWTAKCARATVKLCFNHWQWLIMLIIGIVGCIFNYPTFYQFIHTKPAVESARPQKEAETNKLNNDNTIHKKSLPIHNELTPAERIITEIQSTPPLQRKDISKAYIGIPIDWELFFLYGEPDKNNKYYLMFSSTPRRTGVYIKCFVPKESNKSLMRVTENSKLRITGTIASIKGSDIYLEKVKISQTSAQ